MTNEPPRSASRERIAQAERDIAAAEVHLTGQRPLAKRLAADGHAKEAEALLRTMEQALHVMQEHRAIILQEIARAEKRDSTLTPTLAPPPLAGKDQPPAGGPTPMRVPRPD